MEPVIEIAHNGGVIRVELVEGCFSGMWNVIVDGEIKHSDCNAEDVLRVLETYLSKRK